MAFMLILPAVLSAWHVGVAVGGATPRNACEGGRVTVVSPHFSAIEGCYASGGSFSASSRQALLIHANRRDGVEGTTYGILESKDATNVPRWAIGEIKKSVSILGNDNPSADADSAFSPMEFEQVLCLSDADWSGTGSSATVGSWQCHGDANVDGISIKGGIESITCGCSGADFGQGAVVAGNAPGGESGTDVEVIPLVTGVRGARRVAAASASEGTAVADPTSTAESTDSSTDWDNGFWSWLVISAGVIVIILLCCVGWYIRNPWCKSPPRADPSASVEDAAPQAPKGAFQPWGASAPPE